MNAPEGYDPFSHENAHLELLKLFDDLSFRERMRRTFAGLSAPVDSGEYKFAKFQLQRLSAPFLAIVGPILIVGLLIAFGDQQQLGQRVTATEIITPDSVDDLEEPPPPPEDMDDFDPIDLDLDVNVNLPQNVTAVDSSQPMSPKPAAFDSVAIVKSPIVMRGIYGSRNPGARGQAIRVGRGSAAGETAVMRALRWLKKTQQPDGSWLKQKDAMTALAILSFLAHGERPGESEEFGDTVQAAIQYMMRSQQPDGMWRGNYHHPIATYAMCEAYGMTMNPQVKESASRGIDGVIRGQHPSGGWDYHMKQTDRDDTSVMGWAAQALKAAKVSNVYDDVETLDRACELSVKGFLKNAHPDGGFGYISPGRGGLSSVGILCMQFHGAGNHPIVEKTFALMDDWRMSWLDAKPGSNPQYYFYYATQAYFQAGLKTSRWRRWNDAMIPAYVRAQKIIGKVDSEYVDHEGNPQEIGWWENEDTSTDRPVMDTCLAALQLMVYYRYLPTFKTPELDSDVLRISEEDVKVTIQF